MSDVTQILSQIEQGDPQAAEQLLPLVYDELRILAAAKMAREKLGQTLQATALVHEAYIRLVDVDKVQHWKSRAHFFAAAGEAMRRLLVERARRKQTLKHGGGWQQVELSEPDLVTGGTPDQVVALHEALERLEQEEPDATRLVKLVTFGGFSVEQAGQLLEMSRTTAYRHWSYARAWIKTHIADEYNSSNILRICGTGRSESRIAWCGTK
jgi:RNA polymerase sigma factor (TIGR02999 family)